MRYLEYYLQFKQFNIGIFLNRDAKVRGWREYGINFLIGQITGLNINTGFGNLELAVHWYIEKVPEKKLFSINFRGG